VDGPIEAVVPVLTATPQTTVWTRHYLVRPRRQPL